LSSSRAIASPPDQRRNLKTARPDVGSDSGIAMNLDSEIAGVLRDAGGGWTARARAATDES
jgi:hypothetical protein